MSLVKVKIQFSGLPKDVAAKVNKSPQLCEGSFSASESISMVVAKILNNFDVNFDHNADIFMVRKKLDLHSTLAANGISKGSCMLRVTMSSSAVAKSESTGAKVSPKITKTDSDSTGKSTTHKAANEAPSSVTESKVELFKPTDTAVPVSANVEDEDVEMSVDDARKYQELLTKKANAPSAYVQEKLKKEKELEQQKQGQQKETIQIRVRFPDGSITQMTLKSSETIEEFFQELDKVLVKPMKYNLVAPKFDKVGKKYDTKAQNLTIEYDNKAQRGLQIKEFHQASFIFEPLDKSGAVDRSFKGPFVKEIAGAKSVTQLISTPEKKSSDFQEKATKKLNKIGDKIGEKKVPKWLKLGKK